MENAQKTSQFYHICQAYSRLFWMVCENSLGTTGLLLFETNNPTMCQVSQHHCADAASFAQLHPFKGRILHFFGVQDMLAYSGSNMLCIKTGSFPPHMQKLQGISAWREGVEIAKNDPGNQMGVSLNGGTPKSSILVGFSIINHPFWGTTIFGNTQIEMDVLSEILP